MSLLDAEGCVALKECELSGKITEVKMSGCRNILKVKVGMNYWGYQVESLDLSQCINLEDFSVAHASSEDFIGALNMSGDVLVKSLVIYGTKQLERIDLTGCKSLKKLVCWNNKLNELDISDCVALEYLDVRSNNLEKLDLSQNEFLKVLDCGGNKISYLDVSNCNYNIEVYCDDDVVVKRYDD